MGVAVGEAGTRNGLGFGSWTGTAERHPHVPASASRILIRIRIRVRIQIRHLVPCLRCLICFQFLFAVLQPSNNSNKVEVAVRYLTRRRRSFYGGQVR